jgi:hypothetical protein
MQRWHGKNGTRRMAAVGRGCAATASDAKSNDGVRGRPKRTDSPGLTTGEEAHLQVQLHKTTTFLQLVKQAVSITLSY